MNKPANSPGNRGDAATTPSAAAMISALTLPSIERFPADIPGFAEIPDFVPGASSLDLPQSPGAGTAENPGEDAGATPFMTKVDAARSVINDCVETLAALRKLEDATAACKAAVVERMVSAASAEATALEFDPWQRDMSGLLAKSEIATTLTITEVAAGSLIENSTTLVREQQPTWSRLAAGELSWGHAVVIAQETGTLRASNVGAAAIADYEAVLLERVAGATLPSFRDRARRLREKSHPESITVRTKRAYACRRMTLDRSQDGMSWLNLYLPAPTAEGIWDLTTVIARAAQGPAEARTLTQLRADVAASLLLGQSLAGNGIHPELAVHTPDARDAVYSGGPAERVDGPTPDGFDEFTEHDSYFDTGGDFDDRGDPWEQEYLPGILVDGTTLPEGVSESVHNVLFGVGNRADSGARSAADSGARAAADSEARSAAEHGTGPKARPGTGSRAPEDAGVPAAHLPPMPQVLPIITIPMLSLLGLGNAPAELEGYGPISIEVAKRLTANAPSFYRVLTDPITGEALAVNPESRRVTKKMRAFLRAQDEHCMFPGCTEKAALSDYDHITAWTRGGKTTDEQVEPLCRKHHRIKHFKDDLTRTGQRREDQSPERAAMKLRGWTPTMTESGRPGWTSPAGRYVPPEPREPQSPGYPKWLKKRLAGTIADSTRVLVGAIDVSPAEGLIASWLGD